MKKKQDISIYEIFYLKAYIIRQNVVLGGFSTFRGVLGEPKYIFFSKKIYYGINQQGYGDILRLEHRI